MITPVTASCCCNRSVQTTCRWVVANVFVRQQQSFSSSSSSNDNNNNAASSSSTLIASTPWADPAMRRYKFWNREEDSKKTGQYSYLLKISPESIQQNANIISLSNPNDDANKALHYDATALPLGSQLLQIGTTVQDFEHLVTTTNNNNKQQQPNVIFVSPSCPNASTTLPKVLSMFPTIRWIHVRSAGIDFIESDEFANITTKKQIVVTNAKGQFSSSLAEYALLACSYFAKNIPRLMEQKQQHLWNPYHIEELRGRTMGIIGYGDIGRAVAKLATVYGMKIIALRRHPYLSKDDPYCNVVYGRDKDSLNELMKQSDYVVCSTPSTIETRGMVSEIAFEHAKPGSVFINLGRGPVVDEHALIASLKNGRLKGAALDVFQTEPLPADNELWTLPTVLLSPHNMDQTSTFMHEATEFFLKENLPRFICNEELLNPVDPTLGY